jgi:site-specific recombinase XerD
MLEEYVGPAAARRLQSCVYGDHAEAFCAQLVELGYTWATIRHKLWTVSCVSRWMAAKQLRIAEFDERRVQEYWGARRRRGRTCRGLRATLLLLLEHLRCAGAVPRPECPLDDSPMATLLAGYEEHLRRERSLCESTIAGYLPFARAYVVERLDGGTAWPEVLRPGDVRDFLLARVRRMVPRRAQFMGTALRSFLRFLFLRGETETDLSLAVPTVRQWRLSSVPRHLPVRDVERLLCACDRASATGRRDHAVLLLLARLGLRASEIIALELDDLRWRDAEIVVRGKGLVRDRLPLVRDVGKALALYLSKDRTPGSSRRVFLCSRAPHRGFMHPSTVSTIVARALVRAGLTPATHGAHLLRHSLATTMVRRGASLAEIGQVLRHRSSNTTEIYAKLDFGALRDVAMPWPTSRGAR